MRRDWVKGKKRNARDETESTGKDWAKKRKPRKNDNSERRKAEMKESEGKTE
jgi:hypothetical protein